MVARSDPEEYGKLLVFQFPKQKFVFGPKLHRRPYQSGRDHLAADLAVEPAGLTRHLGHAANRPALEYASASARLAGPA